MKGIILAGGAGTRLHPLTKITSKQLLPVYDRPMIYYPLQTLLDAQIREILIIVAPDRAGDFLRLLGSGKEFGAKFTYEIQDKPEGLAQAFLIGKTFIGDDHVTMILGDNIFLGNETFLLNAIRTFSQGARVFAKDARKLRRTMALGLGPLLRDAGLGVLPRASFLWTSDAYGPYLRDLLGHLAADAAGSGSITEDERETFLRTLEDLAARGDFAYGLVYHRIAGRR